MKNRCSWCAAWRPNEISPALDEQNWATKLFTSHSSHARRARPDSSARKLALWLKPDWRIRANCRVVKASFLVKIYSSFLDFHPQVRIVSLNPLYCSARAPLLYFEFVSHWREVFVCFCSTIIHLLWERVCATKIRCITK